MAQFQMATMADLKNYTNPRFEEGETVYLKDEQKLYIFHDGEWVPFAAETPGGQFSITEYELNKMLVNQLNLMTDEEINEKIYELNNFERNNRTNHYMLLCRDINYYSIFESYADFQCEFETFGHSVIACAQDVGKIVSIEKMPENTFEIWVKTPTDESYCMYLFDCDGFIVPYRG